MKILQYCNRIIEYSFYSLFLLVPLVFWGGTSELFELNKIWLTYGLTIIIATTWLVKMIFEKKFYIQKTPLDIPLMLFLASQIISTIFSLDSYVSFWGYYSRFNGGLLSTVSYIVLYYAFVSHFDKDKVIKLLRIILISGILVALWGLPSHYGYDPTCLVFRGELNVNCWTEAFKPTIRIFSTLGQPAWLAAFLAFLIPLAIAMWLQLFIRKTSNQVNSLWQMVNGKKLLTISYLLLALLFYLCLLYTNTRAGFLGFWIANIIFWSLLFLSRVFNYKKFILMFLIINSGFLIISFFIGIPIDQLNKYSFNSLKQNYSQAQSDGQQASKQSEVNITNSADIRRIVWKGAIDAWKANPLTGSGVETFAFAYYKHKPIEHNLTSEWDYLYNKAHNEYLNYLTTTGILGLGSYLLIIGVFIAYFLYSLREKHEEQILLIALFAGWFSILITNFFGFSVVIMNLYFFFIPALVFILKNTINHNKLIVLHYKNGDHTSENHTTITQWLAISFFLLAACYLLFVLFRYWQADKAYSLGSGLNRSAYAQEAYASLINSVKLRPQEPVFQDELSVAALQLALGLFQQNESTLAANLVNQSVELNTKLLSKHPNYLPFWKTRIRLFDVLAEIDPVYRSEAIKSALQSVSLAPTDAKLLNTLGGLYMKNNEIDQGINILEKTVTYKPDYQDALLNLALLYRQKALGTDGKLIDLNYQNLAQETLKKLININPNHEQATSLLSEWTMKRPK